MRRESEGEKRTAPEWKSKKQSGKLKEENVTGFEEGKKTECDRRERAGKTVVCLHHLYLLVEAVPETTGIRIVPDALLAGAEAHHLVEDAETHHLLVNVHHRPRGLNVSILVHLLLHVHLLQIAAVAVQLLGSFFASSAAFRLPPIISST